MKKKNNKKGFTIIEMVIVIAIIGILAAVLIPTYGNVVANANESAAMQTARSVMTNWLATSTSSAGVPTSGPDGKGNTFYAAYFEYTSGNQTYQYRYTSGGVERTDNDVSKYVNWSTTEAIKNLYLTTPSIDPNFDSATYVVNLYRVQKTANAANGSGTYYVYYIEYPSGNVGTSGVKYAYDFGGATVFAGTSEAQKFYQASGSEYVEKSISELSGWAKATATYTVTYALATEHGLTGSPAVPTASSGNASGAKIDLPAKIGDENVTWYTDAAATAANAISGQYTVTGDVTLYAKKA